MGQITENGFQKQSFSDILEEMIDTAQNIFGEDVDLRDETFLKQLMVVIALRDAKKDDVLEDIYNNISVTQATNVSLDYAVKFQGLRRKKATKSTVIVTFTGEENTTINSGYIVQTENETKFETTTSDTISGGSVDIECEALIAGANGNVLAGTITEVESPLVGLNGVNNANDATGGLNAESDESLRTRYLLSLSKGGGSTADAIRAAILSIENVKDVLIFENETDAIVDGVNPHAFVPYVLGGEDDDIQYAIYTVKSVGIESQGTIQKTFTTDSGTSITIGFERPTKVDIWYNATVTKGSNYPIDGDAQVQNAILEYTSNLGIGEDVIIFALSTYISNNVEGINNLVIETSIDGTTFNSGDITISSNLTDGVEKATTESDKVVIS